jgi:DNA-directed RNA polymerase specialized sigma24 family protein
MGANTETGRRETEFPKTSSALIRVVQERGAGAADALRALANLYYHPVQAYFVALVRDRALADALTTDFFSRFLERGSEVRHYDPKRGRFRNYLCRSVSNFARDHFDKPEHARRFESLVEAGSGALPADPRDPVRALHREFVRSTLRQVAVRVRAICETKGQSIHYAIFCGRYLAADEPSWEVLGQRWNLDGKAARGRAEVVVAHYRRALRAVLQDAVAQEAGADVPAAGIDEEIANLLSLF